jgi:hypothetical protein
MANAAPRIFNVTLVVHRGRPRGGLCRQWVNRARTRGNQESARTTNLYDWREEEISLDEVERPLI